MKYCSRDCQVAHRPKHKKACKKRAAELFDIELFKDPPEREECPICMLPLPFGENQSMLKSCCGKVLCTGCIHAQIKEEYRSGKEKEDTAKCAFCRMPTTKTDKEFIDRLERLVERNHAKSMNELAIFYRDEQYGLQKDLAKTLALFQKAGKLGYADAYHNAGTLYRDGDGVERDLGQARYYFELGAIAGSMDARHNLACLDMDIGHFSRGHKHFLICTKGGFEPSLGGLRSGFEYGDITKHEYTQALTAFQKQRAETMSATRDEALRLTANLSKYRKNT